MYIGQNNMQGNYNMFTDNRSTAGPGDIIITEGLKW